MKKVNLLIQTAVMAACTAAFGQSNPIEGGATQTITNSWTVQQVIIGGNSGDNTLVVSNRGEVSSAVGTIGNTLSSFENEVRVTGEGSLWNSAEELSVGHLGASNLLSVTAGGKVTSTNLYIGNQSGFNEMDVTGARTLVEASVLNVGHQGADNMLHVSDGSRVESAVGTVGYSVGADNNAATVQSDGSWNSSLELSVGEYGAGNRLNVLDGGLVVAPVVNVGVQSTASNNVILVSDSRLDAKALYIGGSADGAGGSGNLVEVADGGIVYTEAFKIYDGNRFDLNAGGKLAVSTNFNAGMTGFNWNEGGALEVGGELTGMNSPFVGKYSSIGRKRSLILNGPNALLSGFVQEVGYSDSGNALVVTNGGQVEMDTVVLGSCDIASNNIISVQGATIVCAPGMIEYTASTNIFIFPYEGTSSARPYTLFSVGFGTGGMQPGSPGSSLSVGGKFYVGWGGSSNRLEVLDGATVNSRFVSIGTLSTANDNSISVSGSNALLQVQKSLMLGGYYSGTNWLSGGVGNSLTVEDGGTVSTESLKIHAGNQFNLNAGGTLAVSTNFNAAMAGFNWNEGSRLEIKGALSGMDDALDGHRVLTLNGDTALWNHAGSFYLGGTNDVVLVGMDNALLLENGGSVAVSGDLKSRNLSMISIDPDSQVTVGGNYYQDATSTLRFAAETNAAGAPVAGLLSVDGTAEFEEGATIGYLSKVGQLRFDVIYTNMIVKANALIVGGVTNAQTADLEKLNAFGSLVRVNFEEDNQDIYALVGRKKVAESAGLTAGTLLANVATEIDRMSMAGNPGADNLVELLNTISGSAQATQLQQHFAEAAPTPMHSQGLGGGMVEVRQRMRVAGPQGPGGMGQYKEAQDWLEVYGSWAEHDASASAPGYEHNVYGTVGGMDWVRGDLLMGVGLGYSYSTLLRDAGQSRASAGYGVGYLSLSRADWFIDLAAAGGGARVRDKANSAFGFEGKYDAGNGSIYLGGGREIGLFDGLLILTPEASMQLGYYYQDRHRETSTTGLRRNVSSYDQFSAQSSLGATLALEKEMNGIIWKPELRVRWLHEFETDADPLSYTLVGGLGSIYSATVNSPEEDIFETGLGLSCTLPKNLSLVFDVDWRCGDDYDAYTGSGRIVYRF